MLIRPDFHLSSLSVEFRWESTRRHPIYIQLWELLQSARKYDADADDAYPNQPAVLQAMRQIGVNGLPIDPATEFEDLVGPDLRPQWLHGGIQPISVKGMAGLLIGSLSQESLSELSDVLHVASTGDRDSLARKQAIVSLVRSGTPELEQMLDAPFYSISPVAPREQMISDLTKVQTQWRERFELPDTRSRESEFANYLRAWDLREGWARGRYDRSSARQIKDIAREAAPSAKTVRNWYCSGFKLISGHEFSPINWIELMGVVQLAEEFGESAAAVSRRRTKSSPTNRLVDDSTISGGRNREGASVVESLNIGDDNCEVTHLLKQISDLIAEGRTNKEILGELCLDDIAEDAIDHLRETSNMGPKNAASK